MQKPPHRAALVVPGDPLQIHKVTYASRIDGKTVTRRVSIPATNPTVAEAVIRAWLSIQCLQPYSLSIEA